MKKLPDKVKALYKSSILIVLINLTVICSTAFGQSTGEASPESPGLWQNGTRHNAENGEMVAQAMYYRIIKRNKESVPLQCY